MKNTNRKPGYSPAGPHLDEGQLRIWKTTPMPAPLEHITHHRDIFYLLVCTGLYYEGFGALEKVDLLHHPDCGPYLQPASHGGHPVVIPLWLFADAMSILEKYLDTDPQSPWLVDRRYLTTIVNFNRALARISTTVMAWERKIASRHARNTFAYLLAKYNIPVEGLRGAFGVARPPSVVPATRRSTQAILHLFKGIDLTAMAGI